MIAIFIYTAHILKRVYKRLHKIKRTSKSRTGSFWFLSFLLRSEEQMALGGGPSQCALPQVFGVFPQTAAVYLVAAGDPHH